MTPLPIDLIRTMHEDQRRRLGRRRFDTDTRATRRKRRRPTL